MKLRNKIAPHIINIVDRLQQAGFETYIVGGAVRDCLLDRSPKDYDLSSTASPEEIRETLGRRQSFIIGRRFRLVHYHHGKDIIEISTFRKAPSDTGSPPPKKADSTPSNMIFTDNEFGNSEEDAWRRDFTVNAIFHDPVKDEIKDFTGMGLNDIRKGLVRAIGKAPLRFEEDPVRVLRALKLVGQYGFEIEKETKKALFKSLFLITHCSDSRLNFELEKILKNPYCGKILTAFKEYGFLKYFLPNLDKKWGTAECKKAIELLCERDRRISEGEYRNSISLAMGSLSFPFVESLLKEIYGEERTRTYWNFKDTRKCIINIFEPRYMTRKLVLSTAGMLAIQPRLKTRKKTSRLLASRSYMHGRELFMMTKKIDGITADEANELKEFWPRKSHAPDADEKSPRKKKKYYKRYYNRKSRTRTGSSGL